MSKTKKLFDAFSRVADAFRKLGASGAEATEAMRQFDEAMWVVSTTTVEHVTPSDECVCDLCEHERARLASPATPAMLSAADGMSWTIGASTADIMGSYPSSTAWVAYSGAAWTAPANHVGASSVGSDFVLVVQASGQELMVEHDCGTPTLFLGGAVFEWSGETRRRGRSTLAVYRERQLPTKPETLRAMDL